MSDVIETQKTLKKLFSSLVVEQTIVMPKPANVVINACVVTSKTIEKIKKQGQERAIEFIAKNGRNGPIVRAEELWKTAQEAEERQKFSVYG
jgi:hypothetical protein